MSRDLGKLRFEMMDLSGHQPDCKWHTLLLIELRLSAMQETKTYHMVKGTEANLCIRIST